ncbi:twin-arginine translocation signal domain-containing protein, partial [Pedobacter sp.]
MNNRRDFLKSTSLLAGSTLVLGASPLLVSASQEFGGKGKLKLRFKPYTLNLNHVFTLSTSSRSTTPVVLTEIEYDGIIGYGEASMPPYLGESHETVLKFLS